MLALRLFKMYPYHYEKFLLIQYFFILVNKNSNISEKIKIYKLNLA